MITRIRTKDAGHNESEQMISHHTCTDDDWDQFAPPSEIASTEFKHIYKEKVPNYYCLDWDKEGDEINIG